MMRTYVIIVMRQGVLQTMLTNFLLEYMPTIHALSYLVAGAVIFGLGIFIGVQLCSKRFS